MGQDKMIVGYARVSTPTQKLRRQIDNLREAYPEIVVISEVYTGSTDNRPKWQKLMRQCRAGIVGKLVFDEVSRFSRNAEEAVKEYKELYDLGIELEFLKEPHINSSIYKQASERKIDICTDSMDEDTANLINKVIDGLNDYLLAVAEKQIYLAFEHAQTERELLAKRTSEGLKQAKLMGSKVGRQKGEKIVTGKQKRAYRIIRKKYELFDGGYLSATECYKACNVSKSTFYRYLQQMQAEDAKKGIYWEYTIEKEDKNVTEELVLKKIRDHDSLNNAQNLKEDPK